MAISGAKRSRETGCLSIIRKRPPLNSTKVSARNGRRDAQISRLARPSNVPQTAIRDSTILCCGPIRQGSYGTRAPQNSD